jgi:hypothetical protein
VIWILALAWGAAVVLALVVLGFAGYEIWWKAARLRGELDRLLTVGDTLQAIQGEVAAVQQRITRTGVR